MPRNFTTLGAMRAELEVKGPVSFSLSFPDAVLIGCGVVPKMLPAGGQGVGTMDFKVKHDEQELQHSRALVERIFMLRSSDRGFRGDVVIGRDRECDVMIADFPVSRQHCRFIPPRSASADATWHIEDLGSSNGTSVNHRKLEPGEPKALKNGDKVMLGRFGFRFFESATALMDDEEPTRGYTLLPPV